MSFKNLCDGEIYHVYNRGVDRRTIFTTESDYVRFLESLFVFNDESSPSNGPFQQRKRIMDGKTQHPLTELFSFTLLTNHFHLLLRQEEPDGISKLMHRIGTGYTNYFNLNENRTGRLFENSFKSRLITSDGDLQYLTRYIHLNPLSLIGTNWKDTEFHRSKEIEKFIRTYPWSSLSLFLQNKSTLYFNPKFLRQLFPQPEEHLNYLFKYQPPNMDEDWELSSQSELIFRPTLGA